MATFLTLPTHLVVNFLVPFFYWLVLLPPNEWFIIDSTGNWSWASPNATTLTRNEPYASVLRGGKHGISRAFCCAKMRMSIFKNMLKYLWVSICSAEQWTQPLATGTWRERNTYNAGPSRFSENSFSTPYGRFVCGTERIREFIFIPLKMMAHSQSLKHLSLYSIFFGRS